MSTRLGLLCAALLSAVLSAPFARASDAKAVRVAFGNPSMPLAAYELYVPLAMNWWQDEGYTVEIVYFQGSGAVAQGLIGGAAPFGMMSTTPWLVANSKGLADIRSLASLFNTTWRVYSPAGNGIVQAKDLKGKTIGLGVAGGGGARYLESLLKKNGLNPATDVRQVVTGVGPSTYEALRTGRADASFSYVSDYRTFEALGNKINLIGDEAWLRFPDYGLVGTAAVLREDPKVAEALARGVVKAQIFAEANPECVARIFRKKYSTKTSTSVAFDTQIILGEIDQRRIALQKSGGDLRGRANPEGFMELQEFLKEGNVIEKIIDSKRLIPDSVDFYKRINEFDRSAVVSKARACEGY